MPIQCPEFCFLPGRKTSHHMLWRMHTDWRPGVQPMLLACFENPTCQHCSGVMDKGLYLSWLNGTCGDLQDGRGLPFGWNSEFRRILFIGLSNPTRSPNPKPSYYYIPEVVNSRRPHFAESTWADFMYNATEAALVDPIIPRELLNNAQPFLLSWKKHLL
jgi:hypothetical protein